MIHHIDDGEFNMRYLFCPCNLGTMVGLLALSSQAFGGGATVVDQDMVSQRLPARGDRRSAGF